MNKWQTLTDLEVNQGQALGKRFVAQLMCAESLDLLAQSCSEFLVHAADVEGLCQGIDEDLVQKLSEWVTIPTTYAGGAKSMR